MCTNNNKNSKLNMVLWKCNSLNVKKRERLERVAKREALDVLLLVEVKVLPKPIAGYISFLKVRDGIGGGLCCMTKSGIKAKRRRDLEVGVDVEMIWIEIGYANKEWKGLLVGLGYRKPMLVRGDFEYLLRSMRMGIEASLAEGLGVVICGDFNAHDRDWDSTSLPNRWGKQIKDLTGSYALLENVSALKAKNCVTYCCLSEVRKSVVDLVFASSGLIAELNVRQRSWGLLSDHFPVSFSTGIKRVEDK